jgi:deoxyribonuclease V
MFPMFLATDVHYDDPHDRARAAGVLFAAWEDAAPTAEIVRIHHGLAPYRPGRFYERELPSLLPLIEEAITSHGVTSVIIDGYVDLGERPGLGRHLFEALGGALDVIGVAKTRFAGAQAIEVLRGGSKHPLFVTAAGVDATIAAEGVRRMIGPHRIPSLLKRADQLARG